MYRSDQKGEDEPHAIGTHADAPDGVFAGRDAGGAGDFTSRFVETDRQSWEFKLDAHAQVILYRQRGLGGLVGMAAVGFQEVTHISEADLTQPHLRFFNERNPLHHQGELLVCMAPLTWRNWRSILGNGLRRLLHRRPARPPQLVSVTSLRVPAMEASGTKGLEESGARSRRAQGG